MIRKSARTVSVLILATSVSLTAAYYIGPLRKAARRASKQVVAPSQQIDDATIAENDAPAKNAPRPKTDVIGVMIAYPVVDKATTAKDARDFAAGIGYYLNDAVAGAPEFGQSPLQTTVYHVAQERRLPDLHLSLKDALRVARASGANYIVTAKYAESASSVTLAYHVRPVDYDDPSGTAPATELSTYTVDNRDALVSKLPEIAEAIRRTLDKRASTVSMPLLAGVTATTLARIGACSDSASYTDEQIRFLKDAGKRIPLAAQLALFVGEHRRNLTLAKPYAELVMKTLPRNTQAMGALGYAVPGAVNNRAGFFYNLSDTYPENYALAHTAAWIAHSQGDGQQDKVYAERSAVDAPGNPEAHLTLAGEISRRAERVRQGRFSGQMDAQMLGKITPLYRRWRNEATLATLCDPLYGKAYHRLAMAATFAGNEGSADEAMDMARLLNGSDPYDTYTWALEMYAPKWSDNGFKWRATAREAAAAHYATPGQTIDMYKQLATLGFSKEHDEMGDRLVKETTATIAKDPKSDEAHYIRGAILEANGRRRASTEDFEANANNNPDELWAQLDLANHYVLISKMKEAEATYRKALALDPDNASTLSWLGFVLKHEAKYAEAEKYLKQSLALAPNDLNTLIRIGAVYALQDHCKQAIPYFRQARAINPFIEEVNLNLSGCYLSLDRYQEAVDVNEEFLQYSPDNINVMRHLGQAYAGNNQWDKAERMNKAVLDRNPADYSAHIFLGDTYLGQRKVAAARKEWQTGLQCSPEPEFKKYAEEQLKKNPAP